MHANDSKRCRHFQIYSEPLDLEGPPAYLAIRRCLLAERLIALLRQSPDGGKLAVKMMVNTTNGNSFAFVGPDLDAVTQHACTVRRCDERCTPAYKQHLDHFQIEDPHEDEVTCSEEVADTSAEKSNQSQIQPNSC